MTAPPALPPPAVLRPLGLLERWYSASYSHLALGSIAITASLHAPSRALLPSLAELQGAMRALCARFPLLTISVDYNEPEHWTLHDKRVIDSVLGGAGEGAGVAAGAAEVRGERDGSRRGSSKGGKKGEHGEESSGDAVHDALYSQHGVVIVPRSSPTAFADFLQLAHAPHAQPSVLLWKVVAFIPQGAEREKGKEEKEADFELVFLFNHVLVDGKREEEGGGEEDKRQTGRQADTDPTPLHHRSLCRQCGRGLPRMSRGSAIQHASSSLLLPLNSRHPLLARSV